MSNILTVFADRDSHDDLLDEVDPSENIPSEDAATQHDVEEAILATIAIDHALARLPAPFRTMMELLYAYRAPIDYPGIWPPTTEEIGRYLGRRFYHGQAIPTRTLWRWHANVLEYWRSKRIGPDLMSAHHTRHLSAPTRAILRKVA